MNSQNLFKDALLWYNGNWISAQQPLFSAFARNANYADGIFETLRVQKNTILFWDLHFERLKKGIQTLQLIPQPILNDKNALQQTILELIQRNNIQQPAKVKILVFRAETNFALQAHSSEVCILCTELLPDSYLLQPKSAVVYDKISLYYSVLSTIKTLQRLPYVLASIYAQQNKVSDAILINAEQEMVETTHSNLFYIVDNQIFTPSIKAGCLEGVLRKVLIRHFNVKERAFKVSELDQIQALFTTNVIRGITPISFCKGIDKHFDVSHKIIRQIHTFLNSIA
ncbi:MAG: aminotransferase class IV [Bacteroidia bacterium]|nr:aminotransferase class IV [Bacteroidia bacterium]